MKEIEAKLMFGNALRTIRNDRKLSSYMQIL